MKVVVVLLIFWAGAISAQSLDGDAYTSGLTGIAEEASLPGAYKGKVAIAFANYYNTTVRQYPTEVVKINALTNRVADEFSITFTLNGSTMESAKFPARITEPEEAGNNTSDSGEMSDSSSIITTGSTSSGESGDKITESAVEGEEVLDRVYMVAEQMPRFPGCEDMYSEPKEKYACAQKKLLEYVYKRVYYPEQAKANGIEGTSVVRFSVQKDGSITDIVIVKSLGYGIDEVSMAVVESMNHMEEKWAPGIQLGKSVVVQFTLPIGYKLNTPNE